MQCKKGKKKEKSARAHRHIAESSEKIFTFLVCALPAEIQYIYMECME